MSAEGHVYDVVDRLGMPLRPARPDLLHFCHEMQGGPVMRMETLAMQRVAEVWRGPGSFEERMMATITAAKAESATLWMEIINAIEQQDQYEEAVAELYFAELREDIETSPTEALRKLRKKHLANERIAFIARHILMNPIEIHE